MLALLLCACSVPIAEEKTATPEEIYRSFLSEQAGGISGEYAVYDMNGDAIPELILKTAQEFLIYWIENGAVTLWHSDSAYTKPLNNGALLYVREGAAPEHTDYIYQVLGYRGEVIFKIEFSEYAAAEFQGINYDKQYYINSIEVPETVYDSVTENLLSINDEKIHWESL